MINRFISCIYLMACCDNRGKALKSTLIKKLTSENKVDFTQQAVTQSLEVKTNSAKLHNENAEEINLIDNTVSEIDSPPMDNVMLTSNEPALPNQSEQIAHINSYEKNQAKEQCIDTGDTKSEQGYKCGLLNYRKWWELNEVELLVSGKLITGTPVFIEEDTLRVINNNYSYFIPLEKIDYIRTNDGFQSSFKLKDDKKN